MYTPRQSFGRGFRRMNHHIIRRNIVSRSSPGLSSFHSSTSRSSASTSSSSASSSSSTSKFSFRSFWSSSSSSLPSAASTLVGLLGISLGYVLLNKTSTYPATCLPAESLPFYSSMPAAWFWGSSNDKDIANDSSSSSLSSSSSSSSSSEIPTEDEAEDTLLRIIGKHQHRISVHLSHTSSQASVIDSNQFAANTPIEDTFRVLPLTKEQGGGVLIGVYDGHSGVGASAFARDRLFDYILNHTIQSDCPTQHPQVHLCPAAFLQADTDFLRKALAFKDLSGACVTVAHVTDNQVITANLGDTQAVLGQLITDQDANPFTSTEHNKVTVGRDKYKGIEISVVHDLDNPDEVARLVGEHPGEHDVIARKRIKGHLQPTRGLGDGTYKAKEFFQLRPRYVARHKIWTPPYSTARPDLIATQINPKTDKFLVVATDGLFQDMNANDVANSVGRYLEARQQKKIPSQMTASAWLTREALLRASYYAFGKQGLMEGWSTARYLAAILGPLPKRRRIHDDITVVVLFFGDNQDN